MHAFPQDTATVDPDEMARFSAQAAQWWNPGGKFAPLHRFNPVRLAYIRDALCHHFGRSPGDDAPFTGLELLDIGCGGGLLSEPMARLGASVLGADANPDNIGIARAHAAGLGLSLAYRHATPEDLAREGAHFDVILNMEVVEHVPDPQGFITACAGCLKPGGLMVLATLNRTLKSFALAIVGAEYVLGWLPRGTHRWDRFITPEELRAMLERAGLRRQALAGVVYNPLSGRWGLSGDTGVNYVALAVDGRAEGSAPGSAPGSTGGSTA